MATSAYRITEASPTHLMITAPGGSLASWWFLSFLLALLLLTNYTTSRTVRRINQPLKTPAELRAYLSRYRMIGLIISFGSVGLFWLLSYSSGFIELDRSTNLVTMRSKMTALFHAQTLSIPLSDVDEAILDYKPNSARIRLVSHSGHDLGYPMWSSRGGQADAVKAINQFLHPVTGER